MGESVFGHPMPEGIEGGRPSVYAEALDLVVSVNDIPCDTEILSGLADRTSLELGINRDGCVRDVSTLLDNDLLRIIDVEDVHYELLRILGILHYLDVLSGLLLELDHMLAFLTYGNVALSFLDNEHKFIPDIHAIDRICFGDRSEQRDISERVLG